SFSQTNVQVQDVDEGDIVKTDGEYLYVLANQRLDIVDARPAQKLSLVSQTAIEGQPVAQYLIGTRVAVVSQLYSAVPAAGGAVALSPLPLLNSTSRLKVTVLDVSNPRSPRITQETYLDGDFVDSRVIGNQLYVVLRNFLTRLPGPEITTKGDVSQYETEEHYRARLGQMGLASLLPKATHPALNHVNQSWPLATAGSTYKPVQAGDSVLLSVVACDITKSNSVNTVRAVNLFGSYSSTVYASREHLYLV